MPSSLSLRLPFQPFLSIFSSLQACFIIIESFNPKLDSNHCNLLKIRLIFFSLFASGSIVYGQLVTFLIIAMTTLSPKHYYAANGLIALDTVINNPKVFTNSHAHHT